MTELESEVLAEQYVNRMYNNHPATRWWAHPNILVGGSINDEEDFFHLQHAFHVTAVISVESEHSDAGKVPPQLLCHLPTPDDGSAPSIQHWKTLLAFAHGAFTSPFTTLYIHCQMGGSRSPAAAYAVLRSTFGLNPEQALACIRCFKQNYGDHHYHKSYLGSVEAAL